MDPSAPGRPARALLLGGAGWHPFNGHFRFRVASGSAVLHVAGAVAASAPPEEAWDAARRLRGVLGAVRGRDRYDLLRAAWAALAGVDPADLGPARGADLALLLVADDPTGTGIAGTGLSALYRIEGGRGEALLPHDHPLLATEGIPERPPGLLAPAAPFEALAGAARSGAMPPVGGASWESACGVRRGP